MDFLPRSVEINTVATGNLYREYSGVTLGVQGTATSSYGAALDTGGAAMGPANTGSAELDYAAAVGATGRPMNWWILMFVLLLALMYGSRKLGTDSDFSNIKLSAYNVLTIGLASIIGISFFKMLAVRVPIPGLTPLILAV